MQLTNHSARKHMVQKLRDSACYPTDIMQISGQTGSSDGHKGGNCVRLIYY
ncbi:hypothetical protein DPMN_097754 [Dreissena polymorpha]|uniref:Uncharacterized protein n=1 Tax=Dreissena polymorpha TaxID=45954 RepID=A0A9D4LBS7_DREPO|nr:hypothetical protein DPMN_097754 [Dreissena polymorpha]